MKSLSAKKLLGILQKNGFVVTRQKGSHIILLNLITGKTVPVPFHSGTKPIHIGTFMAIIKQSGLDKTLFS